MDNDTTLDFWKRQLDLLSQQQQDKSYDDMSSYTAAAASSHDRSLVVTNTSLIVYCVYCVYSTVLVHSYYVLVFQQSQTL